MTKESTDDIIAKPKSIFNKPLLWIGLVVVMTIFGLWVLSSFSTLSDAPLLKEKQKMSGGITILADPSLTVPISQIARHYTHKKQISVSTVFSSTKEQITQIEQGTEAHILISAKPLWVKQMQQKGLIDVYSRPIIARNQLVVVSNKPAKSSTEGTSILQQIPWRNTDFQLAIGDPEYIAEGTYCLESINNLGLGADLEQHYNFFRDTFSIMKSVKNYGSYGIIFQTDALLDPELHIVNHISNKSHSTIQYQAVVVAGENMDGAREFLGYLQSDNAKNIFDKYGFGL